MQTDEVIKKINLMIDDCGIKQKKLNWKDLFWSNF